MFTRRSALAGLAASVAGFFGVKVLAAPIVSPAGESPYIVSHNNQLKHLRERKELSL